MELVLLARQARPGQLAQRVPQAPRVRREQLVRPELPVQLALTVPRDRRALQVLLVRQVLSVLPVAPAPLALPDRLALRVLQAPQVQAACYLLTQ